MRIGAKSRTVISPTNLTVELAIIFNQLLPVKGANFGFMEIRFSVIIKSILDILIFMPQFW